MNIISGTDAVFLQGDCIGCIVVFRFLVVHGDSYRASVCRYKTRLFSGALVLT